MRKLREFRGHVHGIIQLTRWKEYVPFVVPLSLLGGLLAATPAGIPLDWRLAAVTFANILAVAYAFMINDIEDAPDDALDPDRAARNPVTSGRVSIRLGYAACRLVAGITLIFYAMGGLTVFGVGVATLLLSHLYSWRPVRLKAWPVTDIVSHSLMLSGLLLLAGFFVYGSNPGIFWLVAISATLFSVYGQLYNQLRDFEMDKAAGLYNTSIVLGERNTQYLMYLSLGTAIACLFVALFRNGPPMELLAVFLMSSVVSTLFRTKTDMRGGEAAEISGTLQVQGMVIMNLTIAVWLIYVVFNQSLPTLALLF
ncbi:MAG: UbiA family prenyltransferase [bacterium]|nr:UbiA family prenyltransferase [bacterium]